MLPTIFSSPFSEKELQNFHTLGAIEEIDFKSQTRSPEQGYSSKWLYSENQYANEDFEQSFQVAIITSPRLDHEQFRSQLRVAARGVSPISADSVEPQSADRKSLIRFLEYQAGIETEEEKIYLQLTLLNEQQFGTAQEIQFLFDLSNFTQEVEIQNNPTAIPRDKVPVIPKEGSGQAVSDVGYVFTRNCTSMHVFVETLGEQPSGSAVRAALVEWPEEEERPKAPDTNIVPGKLELKHTNFQGKENNISLYVDTIGKPIFTFSGTYDVNV